MSALNASACARTWRGTFGYVDNPVQAPFGDFLGSKPLFDVVSTNTLPTVASIML